MSSCTNCYNNSFFPKSIRNWNDLKLNDLKGKELKFNVNDIVQASKALDKGWSCSHLSN